MGTANKHGQHLWIGRDNRELILFFWDPGKLLRFWCDPRMRESKMMAKMDFPTSLIEVCSEWDVIWNRVHNLYSTWRLSEIHLPSFIHSTETYLVSSMLLGNAKAKWNTFSS